MTQAAIGLAPAIIPIGAAAVATGAGLVTMATAGGAAFGLLGIGIAAALASTTKQGKILNNEIISIKGTFISLGNKVAPALFQPMYSMIASLTKIIGELAGPIIALRPQLDSVAQGFKSWTDNKLQGWLNWIVATGGPILSNFITIGKNLGVVFGDMLKAFGPMAIQMSNGLAVLSAKLKGWAEGGGFQDFLAYIKSNSPQIKQLLSSLAQILGNVSKSMFDMSPIALQVSVYMAKLIAAMPPKVIDAIAVAFVAWKVAMAGVAVVSGITAGLTGMAAAFTAIRDACLLTRIELAALKVQELLMAAASGVATAATWLFNAAMDANPIVLVTLAVIALGVGLFFLVDHWNTVKTALVSTWNTVWNGMKAVFDLVVTFLQSKWGLLVLALGPVGWLILLAANWQTVWTGIQIAAQTVWNALQIAWSAFINSMALVWTTVSGALVVAWNTVWTGLQIAAQTIWAAMQIAWSAFINAMALVWTTVSGALVVAWNTVWTGLATSAKAVWTALQVAWSAFTAALSTAWASFSSAMKTAWSGLWTALSAAWATFSSAMKTAWSGIWAALSSAWAAFSSAMKTAWSGLWSALSSAWATFSSAMKTAWSGIWSALSSAWASFSSAMKTAWSGLWSALSSAFGTFSSAMKTAWSGMWNAIKTTATTIWSSITSGFKSFSSGVQSVLSGLVSAAKTIWNKIVDVFKTPINAVVTIWNKVAGAVGLDSIKLASGGSVTGPTSGGGGATAFAGGGHLSNGLPGTQRNDKIPALLSAGEYVVKASSVRKYGVSTLNQINAGRYADGGSIRRLADGGPANETSAQRAADGVPNTYWKGSEQRIGDDQYKALTAQQKAIVDAAGIHKVGNGVLDSIGDALGGAAGAVGGVISDIAGYISGNIGSIIGAGGSIIAGDLGFLSSVFGFNIFDALKPLLNGIVDKVPDPAPPGTPKPAGSLAHAGIKTLMDGALKFFEDKQKTTVESMSVAGSQSVQAWAPVILQALALNGMSPGLLGDVEGLMNAESGGNPNAINNYDINAQNGVPSQGLMQVIPPTFAAYHVAGTSNNLLDPLANIAAALNYIKHQYGGVIPGSPYAIGTQSAKAGWHRMGERGPEMWFEGGEKVWDAKKTAKFRAGMGGGSGGGDHIEFHDGAFQFKFTGAVDQATLDQLENDTLPKLKMAVAAGVGKRGGNG
jgi:phage-related protein